MTEKKCTDHKNTDQGLIGNEKIEESIALLQQEASQEFLAHVLTVLRRRMKENGQFVIAVEPPAGDGRIAIQTVQSADGRRWWMAFTSFEEEMHGADQVKSTFLADIDQLFTAALTVPEVKGILLNPWNRTIMLDKTLIRIIKPE